VENPTAARPYRGRSVPVEYPARTAAVLACETGGFAPIFAVRAVTPRWDPPAPAVPSEG